ncbi:uncharacterized protein TNCV_2505551 [Trichonephila clavipes]|uniref:Uncharacterized protein n=1 Tax=Trichonephila clavipes TaxID=2585209 RepID=A0A8X6WFT5_TRICX|nr:uncharacterized protein TNCV_2505551 [Trichonephila clavipes]
MSWTYRWAVTMLWINIRGDRVTFVAENDLVLFRCNPVVHDTTPNGGVGRWVSLAAHVMGTAIPDVLQPGALRWFEKTQGPVVKVLPVSGQWAMRQLFQRMRVV